MFNLISAPGTQDTEFPAAASLTDNFATPTAPGVGAFLMEYDGSTWDLGRGDATNGLLVNLGSNNDVTVASGGIASGAIASGAVASGAIASGAFASGSIADGAQVTLGAKADARSTATDGTAITIMQVLKEISYMEQTPASRAVTGTFWQTTQPVSIASAQVASGAIASGAIASGAVASGAFASGSISAGAVAAGATSFVKLEDVASADADAGVPALAVRKATPANTSGTDGDYEFLQISAGRLWTSATLDTLISGEDQTNDVMKTEQQFSLAYQAAAAADVVVKASAGFLHAIICGAWVTNGTIEVSDHASDGDGNVKIFITMAATNIDGFPKTFIVDAKFTTGICVDQTGATQCTYIYR